MCSRVCCYGATVISGDADEAEVYKVLFMLVKYSKVILMPASR